jgi:thiamine pyrophosphate-dependent acetolactate synthase large subunit-like protein
MTFIVLDDRWLSLIRVKQERRDFPYYSIDVIPGDYPDPPAHYFGVPAIAARTPNTLESSLHHAGAASGPAIIEASSTHRTILIRSTTEEPGCARRFPNRSPSTRRYMPADACIRRQMLVYARRWV